MPGRREGVEHRDTAHVAMVAAGTATREDPLFVAPCACRVRSITAVPQQATTGNSGSTKNLNVLNKGAAGAGTTEVANLDLVTGENLVAFDEKNIPLNATALALGGVTMVEGDVLSLQHEQVSAGVTVGPLLMSVDWEPL